MTGCSWLASFYVQTLSRTVPACHAGMSQYIGVNNMSAPSKISLIFTKL
jgi:hypothetical protein